MSPEPTTVPRWKDGQELTQHHESDLTDRYPGSAPEAREGVKASKAEIGVYLPTAGAAWFLVWGLSDNRVGPQKQVLKRSLRNHPIQTHFTDGQTGVQEKEDWVLRSERIPIQGLADEKFPALTQHTEPTESQFDG